MPALPTAFACAYGIFITISKVIADNPVIEPATPVMY